MPRKTKTKRKISLNQNVRDGIPYSKVRVEWIDIISDSGWADEKGFNRMKLAQPINEGWLYNKDKYDLCLYKYLYIYYFNQSLSCFFLQSFIILVLLVFGYLNSFFY